MATSGKRNQKVVKVWLTQFALIGLSIFFLLPLIWMIVTAVKPLDETMKTPPVWIPSKLLIGNFSEAFAYNSKDLFD